MSAAQPSAIYPTAKEAIASEMDAVNRVIRQQLHSDVPLVNQIADYIISAGGKRIRPALVIMMAKAFDYQGTDHHALAAVVEFIHTATLLHDDVVDESSLRRGRETANALFGNAASILVGDFVYSRAFQIMVSIDDMRVMRILADATNVIAEGEVLQLLNMHDPDVTEARYLQVIRSKTAKLFESAAQLGALVAGASEANVEAAAEFGRSLGTAFQLIDDVLDYSGDATVMGKNIGDDLREGKATLPLISAMQRGSSIQRTLIKTAIETGTISMLDQVVDIVKTTGALDFSRRAAAQEAQRAVAAAGRLPQGPHAACLVQLASQLLDRDS